VLPKLNYNVSREYEKLLKAMETQDSKDEGVVTSKQAQDRTKSMKAQLQVSEQRCHQEEANNEVLIEAQRGDQVFYGMNIQLRHDSSGQFLQLSKKSAEDDKTC